MFAFNFSLTVKDILKEVVSLDRNGINYERTAYFLSLIVREDFGHFSIFLNDTDYIAVTTRGQCEDYYVLKVLNNSFYQCLQAPGKYINDEHKFYFRSETDNKLSFYQDLKSDSYRYPPKPPKKASLIESVDLIQACEELVAQVNRYKDLFWTAFGRIDSEEQLYLMDSFFGREERYVDQLYTDASVNWLEFKKNTKFNPELKKTEILLINSVEERVKYVHDEKMRNRFIPIYIYYQWLPLDTAWTAYKKEHNIVVPDDVQKRVEEIKNQPLYEDKGSLVKKLDAMKKAGEIKFVPDPQPEMTQEQRLNQYADELFDNKDRKKKKRFFGLF